MLFLIATAAALAPFGNIAPCGTPAVRAAFAAGDVPARARNAAPTGYDTAHFHIEGSDYAPTDDEYARLGAILEEVWTAEVDEMAYPPPAGDDLFSVYLEPMPEGLYGYTGLERGGKTAYVAINPDMAWTGLADDDAWRVTCAHEFFHAVQYTYDFWEEAWWMEATSTWMEDEVYDSVNDYDYYIGEGAWPDYPEVSMVAYNGWHEYGEVIWPRYLSTFWGGGDVVQGLWESCATDEIMAALGDFFGSEEAFEGAIVDFEARNVLGYAGYEEGADWYPVYTRDILGEGAALPATVAPTEYYADYLGVNYWAIQATEADAGALEITFSGNPKDDGNTVVWQVSVLGTDGETWDVVSETTNNTLVLDLPGFGTTWTSATVLVGILSENTGVDHDQYESSPRYTTIPPTYSFTASVVADVPADTGEAADTGEVADTGEDSASDSGISDSGGDVAPPPRDIHPNPGRNRCGCEGSLPGFAGALGLAAMASRRKERK